MGILPSLILSTVLELVGGITLRETYFLFHQKEVVLFPEGAASAFLKKSFSMERIVYKGWTAQGKIH